MTLLIVWPPTCTPSDPNALIMEFFDSQGITTDKNTERKIENLFFREDFRRTSMDDVGLLDFPSRMLERYSTAFLEALAANAVKEAGFKVVIDYAWGNASIVLPQLLGGLGVDQISLNAYFDAQRPKVMQTKRGGVDRPSAQRRHGGTCGHLTTISGSSRT